MSALEELELPAHSRWRRVGHMPTLVLAPPRDTREDRARRAAKRTCVSCQKRPVKVHERPHCAYYQCEVCLAYDEAKTLCAGCGGTKRDAGPGTRYCERCHDPDLYARQRCRVCGGEKEAGRGAIYCSACLARRAAGKMCKRCGNETAKGSPYCKEHRRRSRQWDSQSKRNRQAVQVAYSSLPERWLTERDPEVNPAKRINDGVTRPDASSFPDLPAQPLGLKIERHIAETRVGSYWRGKRFNDDANDEFREGVCAALGIGSKSLCEWRDGKRKSVTFDTADLVLTRAGWCWFDVWGTPPAERGRPAEVSAYIDGMLRVYDAFESDELIAA